MKKPLNSMSIGKLFAGIILIQLFWNQLSALDPAKPLGQYLAAQWKTADGLPSNTIASIAQTPDGYLWIATTKGLVRFDGIKFANIPFANGQKTKSREKVNPDTLFVDRQGILWIGGPGVLTSYDYKTRQFKTYTGTDGLTVDRIRRIRGDMNGNLWIGLWASYVNRFHNGKFFVFNQSHGLVGKKINAILEDGKGNLLFGSREKGVFKFKDDKFSQYPVEGLGNYASIAMHEDPEGELWIGTGNGLLRVNRGNSKYSTRYTT
ncbi:MAG: hypothetical protein GY950_27745, partial [bacterium]|nr:hypothetical protein [bacterium]